MSRKIKIKKKKPSLKKISISINTKPKLLKIKKVGRWCEYIEGRLPYPIECSSNKDTPKSSIFIGGKRKVVKNTPKCATCKRSIKWNDWKQGKWDKIKQEIKKGADLRDQPSPIAEKE